MGGWQLYGPKDFGKIMSEAMRELKSRADAREISDIIKRKLENSDAK